MVGRWVSQRGKCQGMVTWHISVVMNWGKAEGVFLLQSISFYSWHVHVVSFLPQGVREGADEADGMTQGAPWRWPSGNMGLRSLWRVWLEAARVGTENFWGMKEKRDGVWTRNVKTMDSLWLGTRSGTRNKYIMMNLLVWQLFVLHRTF